MIKIEELEEVLFNLSGGDFITIYLHTKEPDFSIPDFAIKTGNTLGLNTTDYNDSVQSAMYPEKLKELLEHMDKEVIDELDRICDAYAKLI